jgi:hypothetical protein
MPEEIEKIIEPTPGRRLSSDKFYNDGSYRSLRAMATKKEDVGLGNVPDYPVASEEEALAGSASNRLMTPQRSKQLIDAEKQIPVDDTFQLLPIAAKVAVTYAVDQAFTITAVDKTSAGNGIAISFVDPEDVSQALAVSLVEGVVVISHATDETGAITTAAGTLETTINEDVEVGAVVQAAMGDAGVMDFVGDVATAGQSNGIACKKGYLFSDESFLYLALNDVDGETNESADFKKVALAAL